MIDYSHTQTNFDEASNILIEQVRAETRARFEGASIRALRLSENTYTFLSKAGFKNIHHLFYPTPEQLNLVTDITDEAKQEIREKLLWAIRQTKKYFRTQVLQILHSQSVTRTATIFDAGSHLAFKESRNIYSPTEQSGLESTSGFETSLAEPASVSPEFRRKIASPLDIDRPLEQLGLFSRRVKNALMRHGIITLRLLFMHTREMLLENIRNLGPKGMTEIEQIVVQSGWSLAEVSDVKRVTSTRLLAAAFYKVDDSISLAALTARVNYYSQPITWDENSVAESAANHPYIVLMEGGRYRFQLQPIDAPSYLLPERRHNVPSAPDKEVADLDVPIPYLLIKQSGLDELLEGTEMFSKRVTNALVRHGIITPRLLLMHTPELLLQEISNLGPTGLAEIEKALAGRGWELAKSTNVQRVNLYRLLAAAFCRFNYSIELSALTHAVNDYSQGIVWTDAEVAVGAAEHPYFVELKDGRYLFSVHPVNMPLVLLDECKPPAPILRSGLETSEGKLLLAKVWLNWINGLKPQQVQVLFLRYGVLGEEPLTLEEISNQLDITRERVRQIEAKALKRLMAPGRHQYRQLLRQHLSEAVQQSGGLLTTGQWEHLLNEKTVWEEVQTRPFLLPLLCAALKEYHYIPSYNVTTAKSVRVEHLRELDSILQRTLRSHKVNGLTAKELITETQGRLSDRFPAEMLEPVFILAALDLFERVGINENGRYVYFKQEQKPRRPAADFGWAGKPGTRLYDWEQRLRQQFEKVAWIGQIPLTEADFRELCEDIQREAQERNPLTGSWEGQPRLVPAATFMTALVFAARYSEQEADEFWSPYLRTVWQAEYTQALMARCRKRFINVVPYLEQTFNLEFPRQTEGDLVAAVYRHTLLPRYVQDDLAAWLRSQWQEILRISDSPDLLAAELRQDKSVNYLPVRLQDFIRDRATEATAVALISNMAAAISLYVNDGESIEKVSDLLADRPIEQALWREVAAQINANAGQNQPTSLRYPRPRLTWVWDLANEEMTLRVQNIILPADSDLEGEPTRLVWLETTGTDPLAADIEVALSPWRMSTGERVINDIFLDKPDGPLNSQLIVLTDMDEVAARLDVPPFPGAKVQFFRPTQQGAYGIPVEPSQVTDGAWLVCAARPLTFLDEDETEIEPDTILDVPYPLNQQHQWAAQVALNLPITVNMDATTLLQLTAGSSTALVGRPSLVGMRPIAGLSRQVQPTFADTQVSLVLEQAGEQLLKQASLWLQGQNGGRWQRPLAELLKEGHAEWQGTDLHIYLQHIIPAQPDFYLAELRASLQPLLLTPLQFAIVPGLEVTLPPDDQLYTPANPPQLLLQGVEESVLVRRDGLQVEKLSDGRQHLTWYDLRQEPRLILRFDKVDIPLAWPLPRFMVWVEPKSARPFLTLAELQGSSLNAIRSKTTVAEFRLFIPGQRYRPFSLRKDRYSIPIGQSQLYDMVKLAETPSVEVKVQVDRQTWTLLEVRQRPQLTEARLKYDDRERLVHFYTGLIEAWVGDGRFIIESLTNPFAPPVELGRTNNLQESHRLPVHTLAEDVYLLRLKLDGVEIPLDENAVRFTVGSPFKPRPQTGPLAQEIRGGQLIPAYQAEDFVLLWAENAERETAELTAATLYQLATVPAVALENFDFPHLRKLWPPLERLKAVRNQLQWVTNYGYLPAWILLEQPIILSTAGQGHQLRVYPLQVAYGGREGRGYGCWPMSTIEGAPKEPVIVQWRAVTDTQVQVEAGLIPDGATIDWMTIDVLDTYALYHCARCGRLVGAQAHTLPDELQHEHLHGHPHPVLRNITEAESHGGYQLLAELLSERRGPWLMGAYAELGMHVYSAATYLPEPAVTASHSFKDDTRRMQLLAVLRETKRFGMENINQPYWASASRLLADWRRLRSVSEFGQTVFALSTLLRVAAIRPKQFHRLAKEASLSEKDVQELLMELNQIAPDHVQWGLTWAELIMVHSS